LTSKSTFSNSTSKSYALALYELAKESSELDTAEVGMRALKDLLNDSSDFKKVIQSPVIKKEEKRNIMFAIADQSNFSSILKKFLGFLSIKNRLFFLNQIIDSFLNFVSSNKGELKAKLISSRELTSIELEKIQRELSNDFKSQIKIEYKYDPGLIGGLVIQVGSVMVDASIKTKLKQLEKNMIGS
jgi:F-type H+-transporting ATPase subunit delta